MRRADSGPRTKEPPVDDRDNIPAPLVFAWDATGETLDVVPGCLRGLTMLDAAALEDATARAVTRISEANPPTES